MAANGAVPVGRYRIQDLQECFVDKHILCLDEKFDLLLGIRDGY
jgi:hypothetical protein